VSVSGHLEQWKNAGAISAAQHDALAALVRKDRVSVFVELNTLLYLGVVSFVAGVGWTVSTYSGRLGDAAILLSLSGVFAWSLHYCFGRDRSYSHHQVEHPGLAFDYVLYLGCLVFGIELGYLEARFHPFQGNWDHSLLLASTVFFALAYRFDNRLVLSLALSSLAAWCGVRLPRVGLLPGGGTLRAYALAYGAFVAALGAGLHVAGVKTHFLQTYLHVAANVVFVALVSGAGGDSWPLFLTASLVLAAAAIILGVRFRQFAFVVYGVLYGYAGITSRLLHNVSSFTSVLSYFVVSGTLVVLLLVVLARRFGRDA
jgi:hypothetical protein